MKYWAFISYSSKDKKWGQWIHRRLENAAIPEDLRGKSLGQGVVLGKHLRPVFRDRDELAGSAELSGAIASALEATRTLIVLCSRNSARSRWVNKEIEDFQALGRGQRILALILDGEPNASSNPDVDDAEECFPEALRLPHEPLASDLRKQGDGKQRGFLKILAGVAELDFDALYRRHERAQRRRRLVLSSLALLIITCMGVLSFYALRQKDRAEQQTKIAESSEREVTLQRDAARRTLSELYYETAQRFDKEPDAALAWALHAVETDAALLQQADFQGRIDQWMGPWQGPDSVEPTGLIDEGASYTDLRSLKQPGARRLLLQTTERAWSLISWEGAIRIAEGSLPAGILFRGSLESCNAFVIGSADTIEVRAWDSGTLLARCHFEELYRFRSLHCVPGGLILGVDLGTSVPAASIFTWRPLAEPEPRNLGQPLWGRLQELATGNTAAGHSILLRLKEEQQSSLHGFALSSDLQTLEARPVPPLPASEFSIATGSSIHRDEGLFRLYFAGDEESNYAYVFESGTLHKLELAAMERLWALLLDDAQPKALIQRWSKGGNEVLPFLRHLTGAQPDEPLFDGHPLRSMGYHASSGRVLVWNEKQQMLGIREAHGSERWVSIPSPLGFELSAYELESAGSEHIAMLDGASLVTLVDLRPGSAGPVHTLRASRFMEMLEIVAAGDADSGALELSVLSHNGAGISRFHALAPQAVHVAGREEASWSVERNPIWSSIDERGVGRSLSLTLRDETWSLTRSAASQMLGSALRTARPGNTPRDAIRSQVGPFVHYETFDESLILSSEDAFYWRAPEELGFHQLCALAEGAGLLRVEARKLSLLALPSHAPLWELAASEELDPDNLVSAVADEEHIWLVESKASAPYAEQPEPRQLRLSMLASADGAIEGQWSWSASEAESKRLEQAWGLGLIPLGASEPALVIDTANSDGQRVLLQAVGDRLEEAMRWVSPAYSPMQVLASSCSLLADLSDQSQQAKVLGHFRRVAGRWECQRIQLLSPLKSFSADPSGRRLLIATERGLQLFDLLAGKPIGTTLAGPDTEFLALAPSVTWSPAGDSLLFWNDWRMHHYDASNGSYVRTLRAHTRAGSLPQADDEPKLQSVSISPDGQWVLSADATGELRKSRLVPARRGLEALRSAARFSGGMEVTPEGQLQIWQPGRAR